MNKPLRVFQIQLVGAICAELDRQHPGAFINQDMMNAIIGAADDLVAVARAGGITPPKEPAA